MAKTEKKFTVEDGMRTYNIEEIVVTTPKRQYKYDNDIYSSKINSQVVWAENYPTITQPIFLYNKIPKIQVVSTLEGLRAIRSRRNGIGLRYRLRLLPKMWYP